jgi:hypothetical protein
MYSTPEVIGVQSLSRTNHYLFLNIHPHSFRNTLTVSWISASSIRQSSIDTQRRVAANSWTRTYSITDEHCRMRPMSDKGQCRPKIGEERPKWGSRSAYSLRDPVRSCSRSFVFILLIFICPRNLQYCGRISSQLNNSPCKVSLRVSYAAIHKRR